MLAIVPDWVPSEEDFSPSVRAFVAGMQAEAQAAGDEGADEEGEQP